MESRSIEVGDVLYTVVQGESMRPVVVHWRVDRIEPAAPRTPNFIGLPAPTEGTLEVVVKPLYEAISCLESSFPLDIWPNGPGIRQRATRLRAWQDVIPRIEDDIVMFERLCERSRKSGDDPETIEDWTRDIVFLKENLRLARRTVEGLGR